MLFNFLISILCCLLDFVKLLWCVSVPVPLLTIINRESEPLTSERTKNEEIDELTSEGTNVESEDDIFKSPQKNETDLVSFIVKTE